VYTGIGPSINRIPVVSPVPSYGPSPSFHPLVVRRWVVRLGGGGGVKI